jgi:hypothetical protein
MVITRLALKGQGESTNLSATLVTIGSWHHPLIVNDDYDSTNDRVNVITSTVTITTPSG